MHALLLIAAYCGVVAAASMVGGTLPRFVRMTHLRTQLLISFVAGLMLAIASFQMLPHAIEQLRGASWTGGAVLGGILAMFLMLRAFHVHPHVESPLSVDPANDEGAIPCQHAPGEGHSHDQEHGGGEQQHPPGPERMVSWIGMLLGLGLHSLVDGVALAASVVADAQHGAWLGLYGLGTFLAIALHKPLDAFAITSTMQAGGWPESYRRTVNLGFSVLSPVGAVLFWAGATFLGTSAWWIGLCLAVAAGFFICIALADLLPEVHFHSHDRLSLTVALLAGVMLAVGIEMLPGHDHGSHAPNPEPPGASALP